MIAVAPPATPRVRSVKFRDRSGGGANESVHNGTRIVIISSYRTGIIDAVWLGSLVARRILACSRIRSAEGGNRSVGAHKAIVDIVRIIVSSNNPRRCVDCHRLGALRKSIALVRACACHIETGDRARGCGAHKPVINSVGVAGKSYDVSCRVHAGGGGSIGSGYARTPSRNIEFGGRARGGGAHKAMRHIVRVHPDSRDISRGVNPDDGGSLHRARACAGDVDGGENRSCRSGR